MLRILPYYAVLITGPVSWISVAVASILYLAIKQFVLVARLFLPTEYSDYRVRSNHGFYLVSLAVLDSVLRPFLDILPRLGHLRAYVRPRGLAIEHGLWACSILIGLLDLEILRTWTLDK
jgi:hypothetical protein